MDQSLGPNGIYIQLQVEFFIKTSIICFNLQLANNFPFRSKTALSPGSFSVDFIWILVLGNCDSLNNLYKLINLYFTLTLWQDGTC